MVNTNPATHDRRRGLRPALAVVALDSSGIALSLALLLLAHLLFASAAH